MASGLVVVGPDRGGTAELLAETDSPFVFRAGDRADFVRVVAAAVAADLRPHRQASLSAARRYGTWHDVIGRLMDFYSQHVNDTRPVAGPWIETGAADDSSARKKTAPGRVA
jgi:hypothetical protein